MIVKDLTDLVLEDYRVLEKPSLKNATRYAATLNEFFGDKRAEEITRLDLLEYIETRKKTLKPATINRELAMLRRGYSLAGIAGPKIPRLKENNARQGFFSREQLDALLRAMPEHYRGAIEFSYFSSWRLGEVLRLRWDRNLDADRSRVFLLEGETKNGASRIIPLDEFGPLKAVIERAWERRAPGCPWVFHRQDGRPLRAYSLSQAIRRCRDRAGLSGRMFHDLRRTAIRNLLDAGVPWYIVKRISGHKTDSMLDRYNIRTEQDIRRALSQIQFEKQAP